MQFPDYYKILGVARAETPDNIKKAYRKLARRNHPDVSKEADADVRMKEVNEAYAVLSDPEKRAEYDASIDARAQRFRHQANSESAHEGRPGDFHDLWDREPVFPFDRAGAFAPDFDGIGDLDDLLRHFFGELDNDFINPTSRNTVRAEIEIDVEDAFTGAQRVIELRLPYRDSAGRSRTRKRRLKVDIPPGMHDGKVIRFAGQGSFDIDGRAVDLLLTVRLRPNTNMRADKRDIYMSLTLAPWEAALGAVLPVKLPNGTVKVRIPRGVQHGYQLRVAGRGIPGTPSGDLILEVRIVVPPAASPAVERAYQNLAREASFDPRQ